MVLYGSGLTSFIRRNMKNVSICLILVFILFFTMADAGILADGSTDIKIIVSVEFMDDNGILPTAEWPSEPIQITVEKEEDEQITFSESDETENYQVTIGVPFGSYCIVSGESIPGFTNDEVTVKLSMIKGNPVKHITYKYTKDDIAAISFELSENSLTMIKGFDHHLQAFVTPENAITQDISWNISQGESVEIIKDGHILASEVGSSTVKAELDETSHFDECVVDVVEIKSVTNPSSIDAVTGEVVKLPATVDVSCTGDYTDSIQVNWDGATITQDGQFMLFYEPATVTVPGEIKGYEDQTITSTAIEINISGENIAPPTGAVIDPDSAYIYPGETGYLGIIDRDFTGSVESLIWLNSKPEFASVERFTDETSVASNSKILYDEATSILASEIIGKEPGTTIISVMDSNSNILDSCIITVSMDPNLTDPFYIMAVEEGGLEVAEHFLSREDVFIHCADLPIGEYNVKVTEKGSTDPLGQGTVEVESAAFEFNLYEVTSFKLTDNNSKEYFVYMSTDSSYPEGEDQTFQTNFKIESPVPTGAVVVAVYELSEGKEVAVNSESAIWGTEVILAREIGMDPLETNFTNYLNPFMGMQNDISKFYYKSDSSESEEYLPLTLDNLGLDMSDPFVEKILTSRYNDEVKMIGHIGAEIDGIETNYVDWDPPREEPLKIGGYYFLVDTEELNFNSNLNLPNPESEEGELIKAVHITRNGTDNIHLVIEYVE